MAKKVWSEAEKALLEARSKHKALVAQVKAEKWARKVARGEKVAQTKEEKAAKKAAKAQAKAEKVAGQQAKLAVRIQKVAAHLAKLRAKRLSLRAIKRANRKAGPIVVLVKDGVAMGAVETVTA